MTITKKCLCLNVLNLIEKGRNTRGKSPGKIKYAGGTADS